MSRGYKSINVNDSLHKKLGDLAELVAKREGLSKVSLQQLIERLVKTYEDQLSG